MQLLRATDTNLAPQWSETNKLLGDGVPNVRFGS